MFSFIPSVFYSYKRWFFLLDPLNTDTFYGAFSVSINEVWLYVLKIYSDYTNLPRIKAPPFVSPLNWPLTRSRLLLPLTPAYKEHFMVSYYQEP